MLAAPALGGPLVLGALRLLQHPGDLRLVVAHELLRQAARLNQLAVGLLDCVIHQLKVCRIRIVQNWVTVERGREGWKMVIFIMVDKTSATCQFLRWCPARPPRTGPELGGCGNSPRLGLLRRPGPDIRDNFPAEMK